MSDGKSIKIGCGGCLFFLIGMFLFVFVLFHLKDLWRFLERLIQ